MTKTGKEWHSNMKNKILHVSAQNVVYKFTKDPALVEQYCAIRRQVYMADFSLLDYSSHEDSFDFNKDPTLKQRKKWIESGKLSFLVKFAWKSWLPIADFLQHFVFWGYPIKMWKDGKISKSKFWRICLSVLLLPIFYILFFFLLKDFIKPIDFLPSVVLFLVFKELINFPHHIQVPGFYNKSSESIKLYPWEQNLVSRSCYYPRFLSEFFILNFNFHVEHHYFPNLPWYRLRVARDIIRERLGKGYIESIGFNWNIEYRAKTAEDVFCNLDNCFPEGKKEWRKLRSKIFYISKKCRQSTRP